MIKRVLCFENPARLSLKLEQIVIELQDVTRTVPIEDVGVVILDHKQITITHALIDALLANNCAIVTSNDKHLPVGLMLPLDGHNLQSERFREQIEASEPLKKQMWQQTVTAKILGQAHVLGTQHIEHGNMFKWAKDVRPEIQTIWKPAQLHIIGAICLRKIRLSEIRKDYRPITCSIMVIV